MINFNKKNYLKYFEKYTNCKHKKNDELCPGCRECDIACLIERCRYLENKLNKRNKC